MHIFLEKLKTKVFYSQSGRKSGENQGFSYAKAVNILQKRKKHRCHTLDLARDSGFSSLIYYSLLNLFMTSFSPLPK